MDVRTRERLVGALVLVAVVVLFVPVLLKGPDSERAEPTAAGSRSVEIILDGATRPREGERLVPEPEIARAPSEAPASAKPAVSEARPPAADAGRRPPPATGKVQSAADTAGRVPARQTVWAVQLGAFASRDKADRLVAALRSRGYAAFVLEYRADGQLLHRVRVGPEQDRVRAAAVAERLRKDGFHPVVAPHP